MKQNRNQRAERLFLAFGDLNPDMIEAAERHRSSPVRKASPYRRLLTVAVAVVLSLVMLTLTVFAAVPSLRRMLNLPFLSESERKDTVPEDWIGVYTVEDLDNIRNDLDGKYILMNDLTFTDGDAPFTPIGTQEEPFTGNFDGNGYVIRGLVLEQELTPPPVEYAEVTYKQGTRTYDYHDVTEMSVVGLFGFCGHSQYETSSREDSTINDFAFPYLTDELPYRGMISNLGVEGATVRVSHASNLRIGVIAGQASYVAGCYVKDCTVEAVAYEASAEGAPLRLRMGGIAGNVQVMDSCYALGCTLTLRGADKLLSDVFTVEEMNTPERATVFVGGLAGNAYTMVTSYTEGGSIFCDYAADRTLDFSDHGAYVGDLYGHVHRIPILMNYSHFRGLLETYYRAVNGIPAEEPLGENWAKLEFDKSEGSFLFGKFRSYFVEKPLYIILDIYGGDSSTVNPSLVTGDYALETEMYIFDRAANMEELIWLEKTAVQYLGEDGLAAVVANDHLKVGALDCYVLDEGATYKKADFAEFDFKTIWQMKDGRPVLRMFEE